VIARQRLPAQVSADVAPVVVGEEFELPQPAARSAADAITTQAANRERRLGIPSALHVPSGAASPGGDEIRVGAFFNRGWRRSTLLLVAAVAGEVGSG